MKFSTALAASAAILSVLAAPAAAPEAEATFGLIHHLLNGAAHFIDNIFHPRPIIIEHPYPGWGHGGHGWHPHPIYHDDCGCFDAGHGVTIGGEQANALKSATAAGDDAAAGAIVSAAAATAIVTGDSDQAVDEAALAAAIATATPSNQ